MPKIYRFVTADVFTDRRFGGNPLAVILDAKGLSDADMQRIAREFNLSETTFVLPPAQSRHSCAMRIFTPGVELPFAGHPTVGTAIVLAESGLLPAGADRIVIEEKVGPVPVALSRRNSGMQAVFTVPRLPERGDAQFVRSDLCRLLGLPADAIAPGIEPMTYSAGVPFTFIPLRDTQALSSIRFDLSVWTDSLAKTAAPHVFAFTMTDWQKGDEIQARMFAPAMGIAEDPATGGAAAALVGLLVDLQKPGDGSRRWSLRQGETMGRPSLIMMEADIAAGRLAAARIGGGAVIVSRGELQLD